MALGPEEKKSKVILTPDNRLRVFISSTLKELAAEREVVRQSVVKLHLLPVMFEAGARPHPAQELYQAYLAQSQIFIGVYWQSYGWLGPGMEISGLEDEFNLSARLPRLIYVKSPAPNREEGLQRMLSRLQQENTASYKHFSTASELGELVENDLAVLLSESFEESNRAVAAELTPAPHTNIPFPRNPLLGRADELQNVCDWLLQEDVGLVTLTGTGGAGKSRLALEAAIKLRPQFEDGVFLVPLAPVNEADRVIPAIAETLGLREPAQSGPVEEILENFLRSRKTLLLLDNFEQLLDAAPRVAALLEACPQLKILATSRAPLRVRSERELIVQPLPVPDTKHPADAEHLSQFASVKLFIQRAQGVLPEFKVTNDNAPAVAEICHRLDGLPLAIELAAARIKLLTPEELLRRLDNRFEILRGGTRDLPARQQTLRAALDWSYNLLTEPAKMLFRRLSVFDGGCSLQAVEAVCSLDGDRNSDMLDQIETLLDSSLITTQVSEDGQHRIGMLASLRDYAYELLAASGEADRVKRAHAEYYLRFAQQVEPRTRTAERRYWRGVLEQDLENIRGTLEWALIKPECLEIGQSLTITLTYFWALCGHLSEGQQYCERFLPLTTGSGSPSVRAGLQSLTGVLSLLIRGTRSETPDWTAILQTARSSGDKATLARTLLFMGGYELARNEPEAASLHLEESQPLFHELNDMWSEALNVLWLRNTLLLRGELPAASELSARGLAMAREQGDPWLLAIPLMDVAQVALMRGELDKAESTLHEAEAVLRAVGEQWGLGWPLSALAQIQLMRGQRAAARASIAEAMRLGREYGNVMAETFCTVETAFLLAVWYEGQSADSEPRRSAALHAARLCGGTRSSVEYPFLLGSTGTRSAYDAMVAQVCSAIEPDLWERGFQEGRSMSFPQVLDLAAAALTQLPD